MSIQRLRCPHDLVFIALQEIYVVVATIHVKVENPNSTCIQFAHDLQ